MLFCQGMQRSVTVHRTHWKFKQQKTALDAIPVNWEQETEATVRNGSAKFDNRRLEKHWVMSRYSYSQNINRWLDLNVKAGQSFTFARHSSNYYYGRETMPLVGLVVSNQFTCLFLIHANMLVESTWDSLIEHIFREAIFPVFNNTMVLGFPSQYYLFLLVPFNELLF